MSDHATIPSDPAGAPVSGRFEAGDGLRCFAALGVLLFHALILAYTNSGDGVAPEDLAARLANLMRVGLWIFFVLSGYLISRPFVVAYIRGTAAPDTVAYLRNRALRIVPALWLTIVLTMVVFGTLGASLRQILVLFLFAQETDRSDLANHLVHVWSVDVEAAFYVAIPLVTAVALRLRGGRPGSERARANVVLAVLALLLVASLGIQVVRDHGLLTPGFPRSLPVNLYAFLPGIALVVLEIRLTRDGRPAAVASWVVPALLTVAVGAALLHAYIVPVAATWLAAAAAMSASGAIVALALIRQWSGRGTSPLVDNPVTRWVGERSYGVYLLHLGVLIYLVEHLRPRSVPVTALMLIVLSLAITLVLAALSYRFVERPFLRLRHGWRRAAASRSSST